jgi:pimeloyl-ACP methyl ester carboxylesterase
MKYLLFVILISSSYKFAFTQPENKNLSSKLYSVGFENIITTDSGRNYKPGTSMNDRFYYRPVEIDIWYPAVNQKSNSTIQYGEILNLLEQRSNRFQDDTVYRSLTEELVQYLGINLQIRDTAKITHLQTSSYKNADPIQQRFPLIVYLSAYNGMSYENVNLFEWLAAHGYAVACITSVGRYPGNMSTHPADLMEQVNDASFAIAYLKTRNNIGTAEVGTIGYSWGGLAALVLAMKNPDVKAVLSLDGSEMHYYGESNQEDKDFDELRHLSFFQLKKVNVPYAYLESGFKQNDRKVDSVFNILPSLTFQKQYVHFSKATHEDFSCLPSLLPQISGTRNNDSDLYSQFKEFSLKYFDQFLKGQSGVLLPELSLIYQRQIGDSLYPVLSLKKSELSFRGKVLDLKDKEALAYVNVGVQNKNTGTVTGHDGSFLIKINPGLLTDSLKISMVGYQGQTYSISELLKQPKPVVFFLKEKIFELREVIVTTKTLPTRTAGNTTTSRFISVGLPLKFLGSETGIKIRLGKNPVLLKSFTFNISENRLDTAVFRMNIYHFKKGTPSENTLQENVLVPVGKQTGRYTVNLTDYKLVMKDDILLSLEWIEGSSSGSERGAIFLSAGFLNSSTWHRLTSQGEWKKASGIGVGFNVVTQKIKM